MMNTRRQPHFMRAGVLAMSALLMLTMTGCFGVDGQFKKLRDTVVAGSGIDYTVEAEFGIGSIVLGAARTIVGWSDDEDAAMASELLQSINKVQIGAYRLDGFDADQQRVRYRTQKLMDLMEPYGYDAIVRNYENDGATLIMVHGDNIEYPENIKELVVLSFSGSELNIVQLKGDVNAVIDVAVREREVPGMDEAVKEAR